MEETRRYQHHPLLFASPPSSLEDVVPDMQTLEDTAQLRSANSAFIHHRHRLAELSGLVDQLGDHLDPTFQSLKQSFFLQLGLHMRLLGEYVESQWEAEKARLGFIQPETSGEQAEIVDSCTSMA